MIDTGCSLNTQYQAFLKFIITIVIRKLSIFLLIGMIFTAMPAIADFHFTPHGSGDAVFALADQATNSDTGTSYDHCSHLGSHFVGLFTVNAFVMPAVHTNLLAITSNSFISSFTEHPYRPPISRLS